MNLTCAKPGCERPRHRKGDGMPLKFCHQHNEENRERNRLFRAAKNGGGGGNALQHGAENMPNDLSTADAAELADIERRMEERAESMAADLRTIRERRLYRATHDTFEEYCNERWGITRQHANRLIRADTLAEDCRLEPLGSKSQKPVITDHVAREVAKAPAAVRAEVVATIIAEAPKGANGRAKPTAAAAKRAVEKVSPPPIRFHGDPDDGVKPDKAAVTDRAGNVVTHPELVAAFSRKAEVDDLLKRLSDIKGEVSRAIKGGDPLFVLVPLGDWEGRIAAARTLLAEKAGYAACPYHGDDRLARRDCKACGGTMVISKDNYRQAPENMRKAVG